MRYYLLESGSKGNSFVLRIKDKTFVVDCGGTRTYLANSLKNINVEKVDCLFITHTHSDHISQLSMFDNVPIFSPVNLPTRKDTRIIKPNTYFFIGDIKISVLAMSHDCENTVGYVFEADDEKLIYITDTGYVNSRYFDLLKGADYIILESNHNVEMLMKSKRPTFIKSRILSDSGHLSNEDCANILANIVTENTKEIMLAHISCEANTYELALDVNVNYLLNNIKDRLNPNLRIVASKQFEISYGGLIYEEDNNFDYNLSTNRLEWIFNF